jgi:hypothetical protein
MNNQHIIYNALIEYDTVQPVIRYLLKHTKLIATKTHTDTKRTIFKFVDNTTNEVVLETEVEILGIFYDKLNIWSWSWSIPDLMHSENYLSKEILIYALKLGFDLANVKSILTTSRGTITDRTQVDINVALGAYIIKQPYVYPYIYKINNYNLIYYVILLNRTDLAKLSEKIIKKPNHDINMEIDEFNGN